MTMAKVHVLLIGLLWLMFPAVAALTCCCAFSSPQQIITRTRSTTNPRPVVVVMWGTSTAGEESSLSSSSKDNMDDDASSLSLSSSSQPSKPSSQQEQECWGVSFIGGDPCGSKYNNDPFDNQIQKPGMPDDMKARIKALADKKIKESQDNNNKNER